MRAKVMRVIATAKEDLTKTFTGHLYGMAKDKSRPGKRKVARTMIVNVLYFAWRRKTSPPSPLS
jgi:hypothetical protein